MCRCSCGTPRTFPPRVARALPSRGAGTDQAAERRRTRSGPLRDLPRLAPPLGACGAFGGGLTSAGDIEFDANGNLYGALDSSHGSMLAKISRTTGVAAPIGPIGVPGVWGLAIHCCMFFGCTGTGELISINAATGHGTVIGTNGIGMGGMAARSSSCC